MKKGYFKNIINEAYVGIEPSGFYKKVTSEYIYFLDDEELYRNEPNYERIGGPEALFHVTRDEVKKGWKKARLAVGEDIHEVIPGNKIDLGKESDVWFIVDKSFPKDHSSPALISV